MTTFQYSGVIQTYTVGLTGTYHIEADGAAGGAGAYATGAGPGASGGSGGKGAIVGGDIFLQAGAKLQIVVGGQGGSSNVGGGGGGGGGSFVIEKSTDGMDSVNFDEVIAGGGGGGGRGGGFFTGASPGRGGDGGGARAQGSGGTGGAGYRGGDSGGDGGSGGRNGGGGSGGGSSGGGGGGRTGGAGRNSSHPAMSGSTDGTTFAGGNVDSGDYIGGRGGFGGGGGAQDGGGGGGGFGGGGGGGGGGARQLGGGGGGGGSFVNTTASNVAKGVGAQGGNGLVVITPLEAPPLVMTAAGTTMASEQVPVAVDPRVTVSDVDNATLSSATVAIMGGFRSTEDRLSFTNDGATEGNIAGAYDAATGVLVLRSTGATATTAQFQSALRSIIYDDIANAPSTANRTIGFTVNDGALDSATATETVSVTPVNDAPDLTPNVPTAVSYTENAAATPLLAGANVTDPDQPANFATGSFEAKITGGAVAGDEIVLADTTDFAINNGALTNAARTTAYGTITGNGTGGVTISAFTAAVTPTVAGQIAAAFGFVSTSNDPGATNRTVTFTFNDGDNTGNGGALTDSTTQTVQVTPVDNPPTLSATPANPTFTEAAGAGTQAGPVVVFSGASASTVENGQTITGLTFTVGGLLDGPSETVQVDGTTIALGGNASGTTTSGISYTSTVASGTATVALSSTTGVSVAAVDSLIDEITYQDTNADSPTTGQRAVTITSIKDSGGGSDTTTEAIASNIMVMPVDDAPVNTVPGSQSVDATARTAITGLSIADADAGTGNVTTTLSDQRGTLTVATKANGATVTTNGSMSVAINGTVAQINTTLSSMNGVLYQGVNGTVDTLTVTTSDNGNTGTGGPLTAVNLVPITVAAAPPSDNSPGQSYIPTPGPDYLNGTAGDDIIAALAGDDTVNGGGGNDLIAGNQGNDLITVGDGSNTVFGGMDQDTIRAGAGPNVLLGNEGNDVITAGSGMNTVYGGMGDDMLTLGDGGDLLFGGEGSDTITAGNGNNTLVGGQDSTDGADLIISGSGNDLILGNGGDDTVGAGAGNDTVVGGYGNDVLLGNQGDDFVLGNQGNDVIYGGFGDDTLVGGMGDDMLIGGQGNDVLYGNEGTNRFVFNAGDTDFMSGVGTGDAVMDFKSGTDALHFGSGPAGTAQNFGATSTASTSFAAIQALGQQLLNAGDTYAFVGSGGDGYLFTSAGNGGGTGIEDAVRLAGVKTPQAGDIA